MLIKQIDSIKGTPFMSVDTLNFSYKSTSLVLVQIVKSLTVLNFNPYHESPLTFSGVGQFPSLNKDPT